MSLKYEPSSEPLHMFAKWLFLNWEAVGEVEGGGCGEGEQDQHPCIACGVWSSGSNVISSIKILSL